MTPIAVRNLSRRTLASMTPTAAKALLALLASGPLTTLAVATSICTGITHASRALSELAALGIVRRHAANGLHGIGEARTWSVRPARTAAPIAQQVAA